MPFSPKFKDLATRNTSARKALETRNDILERRAKDDPGGLVPTLDEELARNKEVLAKKTLDPLFLGLRSAMGATNPNIKNVRDLTADGKFGKNLDANEQAFVAIYGLLATDNHAPRDFEWVPEDPAQPKVNPIFKTNDRRFQQAVAEAQAEFTNNVDLFEKTLPIISREGKNEVDAASWANVVRVLSARGISADHANLGLLTREALSSAVGSSDGAAPSTLEIDFPDLDDARDVQIIANNIMAMQIFYPSWMLEEARFYDVYDKIEELFLNQMLPVSRGSAGDRIFQRWKASTQRISKAERLNFYATCFGAAGGNPVLANQNREFSDLWLRFVSATSEWSRKLQVDDLLRTRVPLSVSTEQVRKAARDLAGNLSLHGYGVAYFAATELQKEINAIKEILSDEEVRMAYGARDMRQLIEQVSIYELGGARDVTRYFTMATSGAIIIRWLAKKADDLSGSYLRSILDVDVVRRDSMRQPTVKATKDPTDRDLVDACEAWLAVTGTSDDRVSEFAQPSEAPAMTSRPVAIPQFARDAFEGLLPAGGLSAGNGSRFTRR